MTQTVLAQRLNRTQGYVQKVEAGERRLDIVQLREICQALGLDFVEFIQRYDAVLRGTSEMESVANPLFVDRQQK